MHDESYLVELLRSQKPEGSDLLTKEQLELLDMSCEQLGFNSKPPKMFDHLAERVFEIHKLPIAEQVLLSMFVLLDIIVSVRVEKRKWESKE